MENNTRTILLIGLVAVIIFNLQGTLPKQAVADIEGKQCINDSDCPCWGTYNVSQFGQQGIPAGNETAVGIGVATCSTQHTCDMTWCMDIEPVGVWVKDNPWQWAKDNPLIIFAALGIIILGLFWK